LARTVAGLGQWRLLGRFLPALQNRLSRRVAVGPGDDAAVVKAAGGGFWVVTTDMMVENTHFRARWTSGEDLGHKVLAVNLSDLAAMGDVRPAFGVVALGIPPRTPVSFVDGFQRGLSRLARLHGFDIVGGDTVGAEKITASVAAVGWARRRSDCVLRSGARRGDVVMVTGTLGDAAAGLAIIDGKRPRFSAPDKRFLLKRFLRPVPKLALAKALRRAGPPSALMDSSDGLYRSAVLIAQASGVGIRLDAARLPVSGPLGSWARARGLSPAEVALTGGEDYELVLTAAPAAARRIEAQGLARAVGTVAAGRGVQIFAGGKKRGVPREHEHWSNHSQG